MNEVRQLDYKSLTLTQETLGTPSYSAPEQLRGEPPTPKTDLYVWGLLFIECLTGKPTISGSSLASIFHQQLSPTNVPIPPSIAGHPLAGLLRRVLNKKASERASSAATIYRALSQINFASLVGQIGSQTTLNPLAQIHDDTLLISSEVYQSKLTERKQITVLSVLLGVNIEDDGLEHELMDTLFNDQKSQCQDIAIRYGAFNVGSLGDTLLFYFGYPTVSENDTRLCARTALDMVSSLKQRNALLRGDQGFEFSIRIGMHTGLVTCYADAIPEGITPNTALTLSRMADVNQVLCSESTRRLLDSYIDFEPVMAKRNRLSELKIPRYRLLAERQLEAFGFLRGTQKNHAFIGRDHELNSLLSMVDSAHASPFKFAHVAGEAGIGKSRLVFELRNAARTMSHYVAQCLPEHQNNALYPILNFLRYQYSLDSLAPSEAVERLHQALNQLHRAPHNLGDEHTHEQHLNILCNWLSLPLPDHANVGPLPADQQKRILFSTLNALLTYQGNHTTQLSRDLETKTRKLFIFEDMHWTDPTSLEFIAQFLPSPEFNDSDNVFISTSRQGLPESLQGLNFTSIDLEKLTPKATAEFISALFDHVPVSARVLDILISRTDGIPLFIEELVNMLKQKGLVKLMNDEIDFVSAEKLQEVPSSLRDSLQQKLDALVYSKTTAQLAATIGREFDYDLLVAASNLSESQIQNNLNELIEAELIYRQRKVGGDSYIFKHALVRDAAYEGLSAQVVKFSHQRIAESLIKNFPERAQAEPAVVAAHFAAAELYSDAITHGTKAANNALDKSSDAAIWQAQQVLVWIDQIPTHAQIPLRLAINAILTTSHMQTKGWASEEVRYYSDDSIRLLQQDPETYRQELISSLWWQMFNGLISGMRSSLDKTEQQLNALIAKANPVERANIFGSLAYYRYTSGQPGPYVLADGTPCDDEKSAVEVARYYAEQSAVIQLINDDKEHLKTYGMDYQAFAWGLLGRICWDLGEHELALKYIQMGIDKAILQDHAPSMCIALLYASIVHQYNNDRSHCSQTAGQLVRIAEENELHIYAAYGGPILAWARHDDVKGNSAVDFLKMAHSLHAVAYFSSLIADIYLDQGLPENALARLNECITLCQTIDEHYYEAQLYHRRALCLMGHFPQQHEQIQHDLQQAEKTALMTGAVDTLAHIRITAEHYKQSRLSVRREGELLY